MKKAILFFLFLNNVLSAQNPVFQWGKSFGSTGDDYAQVMTMDSSYNVYVAGKFGGTGDFDPGSGTVSLTSADNNDIYISKFDPSGNLIWTKSIGGPTVDLVYSMAIDQFGNLLMSGLFAGTTDLIQVLEHTH